MSFIEGMISSYVGRMTPEQRRQLAITAQQEVIKATTPEERAEILSEALRTLVGSLTPEQRERLTRELAELLGK